jgi:beta-lactamase regulating signal transducer with metallopeptidase domain
MNFFSSVTVQGQFQCAVFQMYYREGAGRSFHRTCTCYKTTFDRTFTAKGSLVVNFSSNVGQPRLLGLLWLIVLRPDDMYYFLCNKTNYMH